MFFSSILVVLIIIKGYFSKRGGEENKKKMTLNFEEMRHVMIQRQILPQHVTDPKILQGFKVLQRESFVPSVHQNTCYGDMHILISEERVMLAPVLLARLIQEAHILLEDKVLILAGSTGYSAIILSYLAKKVVAVESNSTYVHKMNEAFENYEIFNAHGYIGDLAKGHLEQAPYEVIFIEGRVEEIPIELLAQLSDGGRIVTLLSKEKDSPCQGVVIEKRNSSLFTRVLFETNLPYLKEFQSTNRFEF